MTAPAGATHTTVVSMPPFETHRRVLMIAYHFPPLSLSSGYLRPLKFAEYLPRHGWRAEILTVSPRAYPPGSTSAKTEVPEDVAVHRAAAFDTQRHLSVRGRYPWILTVPDRWWTWWMPAVVAGLRIIRRRRPAVLMSTYPIPTAHLIGWTLHRLTGIPWIAEFRDPMTDEIQHPKRVMRTTNRWLERVTLESCAAAVFVAPGARADYARRYPRVRSERLVVVPNGYDEPGFADIDETRADGPPIGRPAVLVHSGLLYPAERDPRPFFAALGALRTAGRITERSVQVTLRAPGAEDYYQALIREHQLVDIVRLAPAIPYRDALREMVAADGLLLFQGPAVNLQIPAKAYEYLRARRPIFALTDPAGDTAALLNTAGVGRIARIDGQDDIVSNFVGFLDDLRSGRALIASDTEIVRHSRQARTTLLAQLLDVVATGGVTSTT